MSLKISSCFSYLPFVNHFKMATPKQMITNVAKVTLPIIALIGIMSFDPAIAGPTACIVCMTTCLAGTFGGFFAACAAACAIPCAAPTP
jgi:hypothetical protein